MRKQKQCLSFGKRGSNWKDLLKAPVDFAQSGVFVAGQNKI